MSTPPLAASGMAPGPFGGPQAQQAAREVNTASLCRIGQETVQDIVYRTMEIFQLLRNMQLPNGVTYHTGTYQDRLAKLQDHLRQLSILFRKLRLVYDKCNENCGGMDPIPVEQLIPYVEEDGSKNEDRTGPPRFASEERREIAEVNKTFATWDLKEVLTDKFINRGLVETQIRRFRAVCVQGGGILQILAVNKITSETVPIGLQFAEAEADCTSCCGQGVASATFFKDQLHQKLKQKNQQLKQIMDQLRNLIWDINAMLAMRN